MILGLQDGKMMCHRKVGPVLFTMLPLPHFNLLSRLLFPSDTALQSVPPDVD